MTFSRYVVLAAIGLVALLLPAGMAKGQGQVDEQALQAELAQRASRLADVFADEAQRADNVAQQLESNRTMQPQEVPELRTNRWRLGPGLTLPRLSEPRTDPQVINNLKIKADAFRVFSGRLQSAARDVREAPSAKEAVTRLDQLAVPADFRAIIVSPGEQSGASAPPITAQTPFGITHQFSLPLDDDISGATEETSATPFIVGPGVSATVDFPAVGALLYDGGDGAKPICTGTLIAPNVVLSAAHCFCNLDPKGGGFYRTKAACHQATYWRGTEKLKALDPTGHHVFFQHVGFIEIDRVLVHHEYDWPIADLAALVLKEPIHDVEPIRTNQAAAVPVNTRALIVGFGVHGPLDANGNPLGGAFVQNSQGLKNFAVIVTESCPPGRQSQSLICWIYRPSAAAETLGSTCFGDSGGPAFVAIDGRWTLVGVTSGGGTCQPNDRPFDVEVFRYTAWIDAAIKDHPVANAAAVAMQLDPVRNEGRFPFASIYRRFVDAPDSWTKKFDLGPGFSLLRFAINGTPDGSKFALELESAANPQARCVLGGDDVAYFCDMPNPTPGPWSFTVKGSKPREFQIVATIF